MSVFDKKIEINMAQALLFRKLLAALKTNLYIQRSLGISENNFLAVDKMLEIKIEEATKS